MLFVSGELLAVPSVVAIGCWLDQITPRAVFRGATPHRVAAGIAAGIVVNCGYFGYFLATSVGSQVLPTTTAFAFSACNPVVTLVLSEAWGWCQTSTRGNGRCNSYRALTAVSLSFYGAAIALLATL